jgi:hypothetical protein
MKVFLWKPLVYIHTLSLSLSLRACFRKVKYHTVSVFLSLQQKKMAVSASVSLQLMTVSVSCPLKTTLFRSKQHTVPSRTFRPSPAGPRLFRLFSLAPSDCLLSVSLVFCLVSVSVYAFTAPKILGITGTGLGVLARACFRKAKYHTVFVFLCV